VIAVSGCMLGVAYPAVTILPPMRIFSIYLVQKRLDALCKPPCHSDFSNSLNHLRNLRYAC